MPKKTWPAWAGPALLWLAAVRTALGIVAIPLAPALFHQHFVVLVLLRPTKEVLLAGGFLLRRHDVSLPMLMLASIPLLILGVWHSSRSAGSTTSSSPGRRCRASPGTCCPPSGSRR